MTSSAGHAPCCPYLFYDDLAAAIAFLTGAFGFEEQFADRDDGKVHHARLGRGGAVVMLGETGTYEGYMPRRSPSKSGSISSGIYVFVEDVDAHAERAKAAGAKITMAPADMHWGDRLYCAEDPEGQFWMFATPIDGAKREG
jgi:PhnB protein